MSDELIESLPEDLLVVTPDRAQQAHTRLACIHRLLQLLDVLGVLRIPRVLHLIDDTQVKEALVDYLE